MNFRVKDNLYCRIAINKLSMNKLNKMNKTFIKITMSLLNAIFERHETVKNLTFRFFLLFFRVVKTGLLMMSEHAFRILLTLSDSWMIVGTLFPRFYNYRSMLPHDVLEVSPFIHDAVMRKPRLWLPFIDVIVICSFVSDLFQWSVYFAMRK